MNFLTKEQAEKWLEQVDCQRSRLTKSGIRFNAPTDSGRKTALSRLLVKAHSMSPGLFFVYEFGIWPSCENMQLFKGYRRSLGEARELFETPGHLFEADDLDQVEALCCLGLYFFWGIMLVSSDGEKAILVSHDGEGIVFESDPLRPIYNALREFLGNT